MASVYRLEALAKEHAGGSIPTSAITYAVSSHADGMHHVAYVSFPGSLLETSLWKPSKLSDSGLVSFAGGYASTPEAARDRAAYEAVLVIEQGLCEEAAAAAAASATVSGTRA